VSQLIKGKWAIMSKGKRVLVGLGIAIVICSMYARFFGVQTVAVWKARRVGRQQPVVWITPIQLADLSVSPGPHTKLSYFGYQFEVPWDDIDQGKTRVAGTGSAAIIGFRSGNVVIFWIGPPKGLVSNLSRDGIDRISLGRWLGDEAAQSDYDLKRAILEVTPDKFSVLMPRSSAIQQDALFSMKAITMPKGAESGIFFVNTNEFKGFQYGRPQTALKNLRVELFNSDVHLDVLFGQKPNGSTTISQADVNCVAQSVHKLPGQGTTLGVDSHK
jgi:hypothetical protein